MMHLQRNPYEVLGLPPVATTEDIKKKYRELARKYHPDLVQDKALGQKVFMQINQAYRILSDPERRAQYDESQRAANSKATATRTKAPINGNGVSANGSNNGHTVSKQTVDINTLLREADMAIMDGQADKAKTICHSILAEDANNARAYGLLGDAYKQMGKSSEALKAYRKSLAISPSSVIQSNINLLEASSLAASTQSSSPSDRSYGSKVETATSNGFFNRLLKRK